MIKKYLPFILLGVGLLVAVGAVIFVSNQKKSSEVEEEDEQLINVSLNDRPLASLIPRSDGHWLDMKIEKLGEFAAETLDYELLYTLPDGRTQGVPGTVELEGKKAVEAELLLGSESSGKFRYDEGVDGGSLSLKFRNDKGKVIARFMTNFTMATATDMLASADDGLSIELSKETNDYFIIMETFGVPGEAGEIVSGPYGVFTSAKTFDGKILVSKGVPKVWSGSSWADPTGPFSASLVVVGE